jgi:hypothetical protein
VTVSAATLLHLAEEPGELTGWGVIDADTARALAADGEWRRWLLDEGSGWLLDVGSRTYRPTVAMDRFVRGRDRTCRPAKRNVTGRTVRVRRCAAIWTTPGRFTPRAARRRPTT